MPVKSVCIVFLGFYFSTWKVIYKRVNCEDKTYAKKALLSFSRYLFNVLVNVFDKTKNLTSYYNNHLTVLNEYCYLYIYNLFLIIIESILFEMEYYLNSLIIFRMTKRSQSDMIINKHWVTADKIYFNIIVKYTVEVYSVL